MIPVLLLLSDEGGEGVEVAVGERVVSDETKVTEVEG